MKGEQKIDNQHKGISLWVNNKEQVIMVDSFEKKIVDLIFEKLKDEKNNLELYMFVVLEDGEIYSWVWAEDRWKFNGKNNISYTNKSVVKNVMFNFDNSPYFLSLEKLEIVNSSPTFRIIKKSLKVNSFGLEMGNNQVLVSNLKTPICLYPSVKGIWVITQNSICFYNGEGEIEEMPIKTPVGQEFAEKMEENQLPIKKQRNFLYDLIFYYFNENTKELLLVESSGVITICSIQKNHMIAYSLCKLNDFSCSSKIRDITLIYQTLAVCQSNNSIEFYDINNGFMLDQVKINNSKKKFRKFWKSSQFANSSKDNLSVSLFGFIDKYDGIWQIVHPTIVSLAARQDSCKIASKICEQWGLKKLEAKYLLEEATEVNVEYQRKIDVCNELIGLLSSPALTIAILSEDSLFQKRFLQQIDLFLNKFQPSSSKNESVTENNSAMNAFHLFTSMNESLFPLLQKYRSIIEDFQNLALKNDFTPKNKKIVQLKRENFEFIYLTKPRFLFDSLFNELELESLVSGKISQEKSNLISDLLFPSFKSDEKQDSDHFIAYFDVLSFLFYCYKPHLLLSFLSSLQKLLVTFLEKQKEDVNTSDTYISTKNKPKENDMIIFDRALRNLPPLLLHEEYANLSPFKETDDPFKKFLPNDQQLEVYTQIMCQVDRSTDALKLMLYNFENWDKALQILESRMNQDTEHYQLFHIAISYCFENEYPEKCQDLWKYMPRNFSILQLMRIIKTYIHPENPNEIIAGKDEYSISDFYDQLKIMMKANQK